jgi:hypothetical protein
MPRQTPRHVPGEIMQKSALLSALKAEIQRHDFSHFVDDPPSVAQGGKGMFVADCSEVLRIYGYSILI